MRRKQDITIVSGTGRSGTTFLMRIFILLEMNTGFSPKTLNIKSEKNPLNEGYTDSKSNSGLERILSFNPRKKDYEIIKQPCAYIRPDGVKKIYSFYNPTWIIPIRKAEDVAKSRARLGNGPGGFWPKVIVKNEADQLDMNHKMLSEFLHVATELGIEDNIIYLDFKRMNEDSIYVFNKLKFLFDKYSIGFAKFEQAYDTATKLSKPKSSKVSS